MNSDTVLVITVGVAATLIFGVVLYTCVYDQLFASGIITDKFITDRFTGEEVYHFILNNTTSINVNTKTYYQYDIGDYFKRGD